MKLFSHFLRVAREVRKWGGEVSFEWPKSSIGWGQPQVMEFITEFNLHEALCDGCAFGMVDKQGHPVLKPWRIATSCERLAKELSQFRCSHEKGFKHSNLEGGSVTPSSAFYPKAMCTAALQALFPETALVAPAMPTVPSSELPPHAAPSGHCENDTGRVDKVLPSQEPVGLVFETDPQSPAYSGPPLSFSDFDAVDLEIDAGQDAEVLAAVTRLLSRSEMMSNPKAKEAVEKEAQGLAERGTWDLSTVTERGALIADAKKSGIRIHLGQLMTICSEKFSEMAEHLRVLKGRIVFRGDICLLYTSPSPRD